MGLFFFLTASLCAQSYSSATIVNAATGQPELAPNGLATIYGKDFSLEPREIKLPADLVNGELPLTLPGTGVRVTVEGIPAPIWYVSPVQIDFLVPSNLLPKRDATVVVTVFGRSGPRVNVNLMAESPGLFQHDPETPATARLDGTPVKADRPARPGEEVILFATGLGRTDPDTGYREVVRDAAGLVKRAGLQVLLNGLPVSDDLIRFAGTATGTAGLYHVRFVIPENSETNPSVQIAIGAARSQTLRLPVRLQ